MLIGLTSAARVWGVVAVKSRKETFVEEVLSREGIEHYCPRLKSKRRQGGTVPLFPGYLFVYFSPKLELATVKRQPGVLKPLVFQEQLACVEPELIEKWREREAGRGFLSPELPPPFLRGQKVHFTEGAFQGLQATVLEVLPSRERVRLLIEHLGGALELEADRQVVK